MDLAKIEIISAPGRLCRQLKFVTDKVLRATVFLVYQMTKYPVQEDDFLSADQHK